MEQTAVDQKITIGVGADTIEVSAYVMGGSSLTKEKIVETIWKRLLRDKSIPAERKERIKQNREKIEQQIITSVEGEFKTEEKSVTVTMRLPIFEPASLRSIVKIACNYFAYHNRDAFLLNGCNNARKFVRRGIGPGQILLVDGHVKEVGALCHAVAFEVFDDHEAVALVTLFGKFHFLVRIGNVSACQTSLVRKQMYVVNQVEQKTWQLNQEWSLPKFDFRPTLWDTVSAVGRRQLNNFILAVESASMVYSLSKSDEPRKLIDEHASRIVDTLMRNEVIRFKPRNRSSLRRAANGQWVVNPKSRRFGTKAEALGAMKKDAP